MIVMNDCEKKPQNTVCPIFDSVQPRKKSGRHCFVPPMAILRPLHPICCSAPLCPSLTINPKRFCAPLNWRMTPLLQHQEQQPEQQTQTDTWQPNLSQSINLSLLEQTQAETTALNTEPHEGIDELLAFLQTESQRIRKQTLSLKYAVASVAGLAIVSTMISGMLKGNWDFTTLVCFSGLLGGVAMASTDKMKAAAIKLSQYNNVRAVGVLVEASEWTSGSFGL